jgi:hypothetical protein
MVLVPKESRQIANYRRTRGGSLLLGALLTIFAGCIPSSGEYPYRSDNEGLDAGSDARADACVPPADEELCESIDAECGAVSVTDPCGSPRTIACGDCSNGAVCNTENVCCQQDNDSQFCAAYSAQCGTLEATDNCGRFRTVSCPDECSDGVECNGTTCGECDRESDREFCDRFQKECGELTGTDSCGDERTVDACGDCRHGAQCESGVCVCPGGKTEVLCDDDEDNDCDGLKDCEDDDCLGKDCGGILAKQCNAEGDCVGI